MQEKEFEPMSKELDDEKLEFDSGNLYFFNGHEATKTDGTDFAAIGTR